MKISKLLFLSALFSIFFFSLSYAHKVTIFAWCEGDEVFTQSKFSGGKKVINGEVLVFNLQGKKIVEGKTDKEGMFSFKLKKKEPLDIVLNAGVGHKAKWRLDIEDDINEAEAKKETTNEDAPQSVTLDSDNINNLDKLLDKKIRPLILMIDELKSQNKFKDIVGGIGYIFGFWGLFLLFYNRKK